MPKAKTSLTQALVREYFHYDPETGHLTWIKYASNKAPVGSRAGSLDKQGYLNVGLRNSDYKAHRLAWLWMTGEWPKHDIDHINGVPGDNRWCNLRDVPHSINGQNRRKPRCNSKGGVLGVYNNGYGFVAQLTVHGKLYYLGRFTTAEAAQAEYLRAKRALHKGNTL